MYRYKLADLPETAGASAIVLEGVRLLKSAWLNSKDRLDFKAFRSLIDEEEADSLEEFDLRDTKARSLLLNSSSENIAEVSVVDPIENTSSPLEAEVSVVSSDEIPSLSPSSEKEKEINPILFQLKDRGFSDRELRGRSNTELRDLLSFDMSIYGRNA